MAHEKIIQHRINKPLEELKRKAQKARRRAIWTVEELDLAAARAEILKRFVSNNADLSGA